MIKYLLICVIDWFDYGGVDGPSETSEVSDFRRQMKYSGTMIESSRRRRACKFWAVWAGLLGLSGQAIQWEAVKMGNYWFIAFSENFEFPFWLHFSNFFGSWSENFKKVHTIGSLHDIFMPTVTLNMRWWWAEWESPSDAAGWHWSQGSEQVAGSRGARLIRLNWAVRESVVEKHARRFYLC